MKPDPDYVTVRLRRDELLSLLDGWTYRGWDAPATHGLPRIQAARVTVRLCAAYYVKPPNLLETHEQRIPGWAIEALAFSAIPEDLAPRAVAKALKTARAAGVRDGQKLVAKVRGGTASAAARKRMAEAARRSAKRRARAPNGSFAPAVVPRNTLEETASGRD